MRCEVLRRRVYEYKERRVQVCNSLTTQEELATYNAVLTEVGQALMAAASQLLAPANIPQLDFEGDADEFGQYLCETMALHGASHLNCVGGPDQKIVFLQQVRVCPFRYPESVCIARLPISLWLLRCALCESIFWHCMHSRCTTVAYGCQLVCTACMQGYADLLGPPL